ncbi:hypothetical protein GALL_519380 [mine drainage metagenome]|uniref:Uncharacterized protein n=1 Tax=mine drainage metagenome TaxID=410659 RepID=A0A1J5P5M6_9ZZZZ
MVLANGAAAPPSSPNSVASTDWKFSIASLRVGSTTFSARRVSPGASPRTVKNDNPAAPRASTTIRSAVCPSTTKLLTPSSRYPPPSRVAGISTPDASHRPFGSVNASAAMQLPSAIAGSNSRFCASVPALTIAVAASTVEEKYGAHSSARPISSSTMPSSTKLKPWPPYASGIWIAVSPSCWFNSCHAARSQPASVSIRRRTAVVGDLSSRNRRRTERNSSCSLVKLNCMRFLLDTVLPLAGCRGCAHSADDAGVRQERGGLACGFVPPAR